MATHVVITGQVQGVGYRAWTADEARSRGLTGWVRNRRDGSVEAVFSGEPDAVNAMVAACRNGPSYARVENVTASEAGDALLSLSDNGFRALPTV